MKRQVNILIIGLTFGLFTCNSSAVEQKKSTEKNIVAENNISTDTQTILTTVKDLRDICTRGQAKPIIKKSIFPKTKFILQPDSLTAIETTNFDNGDKLIIKNWGCDYFVLTFHFETSRFKANTAAVKYWYVTAYKMLTEIKQGIDAPIGIEKGLQALNEHISKNALDLKLQTEIDFGGSGIRSFVTVEKVEKIADKKYALTISFATGPL